jgi:hypothetical protein
MAIELTTKDAAALTDPELEELAAVAEFQGAPFDFGFLSKQREEWVLAALAREGELMLGGALFTLERIGGTPCVLVNLLLTRPKDREPETMVALMHEAYSRALLAFPDEDVLVATKVIEAHAYDLFKGLSDVVPRPGHRPSGEERAWARRLGKRFGLEQGLDDRAALATSPDGQFGYVAYRLHEGGAEGYEEVFACCTPEEGQALIVSGWVLAEQLAEGSVPVAP